MSVENLITKNIDIWTAAVQTKSTAGRGTSSKLDLYGIKKLRELILELAVRGKLVAQDPNDEPASLLLERITKEKAQLVKDKIIKKQKALPEVDTDEFLFEIPEKWSWTRLGSITEIGPRNTNISDDLDVSFVPMPLITTNTDGRHGSEIKKWGEIKKGYTHFANGDIALAKITPCFENSKAAIFSGLENGVGAGTTELHVARPIADTLDARYILLFLKAPIFLKVGETKMTGSAGQKRVPKDFFAQYPLPFPPLKEQRRIVAKVDELMKLCDQLEQQTEASIAAHQVLVETLLATLTNSADAEELMENWQRISAHFDTLFTTEESIDQLKQTILQLAVMGKLVPQNPAEEPASELLKRIAKEKAQLVKEGKIKKQKASPSITDDEKPFELPNGWCFSRLENLSELITKGSSPKWQGVSYTENPEDVLFVTSENVGAFNLLLDNKKYVEKKFNDIEPRSILKKYDFLMNIVGASIGRTALYDLDDMANINQAVCLIRSFPQQVMTGFFLLFFNSRTCVSYMYDKQVENARPNLSMGNIAKFVIPVPPLEEQKRIVARVAEFMEVCEQLQTCIKDVQTTQMHLTDAIVKQAM